MSVRYTTGTNDSSIASNPLRSDLNYLVFQENRSISPETNELAGYLEVVMYSGRFARHRSWLVLLLVSRYPVQRI